MPSKIVVDDEEDGRNAHTLCVYNMDNVVFSRCDSIRYYDNREMVRTDTRPTYDNLEKNVLWFGKLDSIFRWILLFWIL